MTDDTQTMLALARLEASIARLEETLFSVTDAFARLRRVEALVERIALGMGISPHG